MASSAQPRKFGTFGGVFTPSVLTIVGVIMFLRMGWVVAQVGLPMTWFMILLASTITFLTGLSIATTATNMRVAGGGAYFILSRSLGLEAGAAVGIPLYFAQTLGIAFYLAGFAETLRESFPTLPTALTATGALLVLAGVAYRSADSALKVQFLILATITAALLSFFLGGAPADLRPWEGGGALHPLGFWGVFAVFFPAVTGIEAGLSMSGDLAKPERALPVGTLSAILLGTVIYLAIATLLHMRLGGSPALASPQAFVAVSRSQRVVQLGIYGATLSSALGCLLGAPRTLQALARDRVLWRFLAGDPTGAESPKLATALTFVVALVAIGLGDLNSIAPILSMFFLTSYGMLNFSAAVETFLSNPSWRPSFRISWGVAAAGAVGCFATMFMIDPGATLISIVLTLGVYSAVKTRHLRSDWGDVRRGMLAYVAKHSIERLAALPPHTKSWRPNVLVLSGAPTKRWYLIELGYLIASKTGFLTVATVVPPQSAADHHGRDTEEAIKAFVHSRQVPAFVRVAVAENVFSGAASLVRNYGLGPIVPNTIVLGDTEDAEHYPAFVDLLFKLVHLRRNVVIVRVLAAPSPPRIVPSGSIDIWWGRERNNAGLALALGYLIQSQNQWAQPSLTVKSVTHDADELASGEQVLSKLIRESRLDAEAKMLYHEGERERIFETIAEHSRAASLVFLGMKPPSPQDYQDDPDGAVRLYVDYYTSLLARTAGFGPVAFVIAAEDLDFHTMFRQPAD